MATGNWKQIGYSELSDSQDNITVEWTGHYENIKFSYRAIQSGTNGIDFQGKAGSNWKTSSGDYYYYYQAAADGSNAEYGRGSTMKFWGNYGNTSDLNQVNGDILNVTGERRIATAQVTSFQEDSSTEIQDSRWYTWMNNTADDLLGLRVIKEAGKNDFTAGSSLTVWAHDDGVTTDFSKDSITNVPDGTRYEETDTRKIFRRKAESAVGVSPPSGLGDKCWDMTNTSSVLRVEGEMIGTGNTSISFWCYPITGATGQESSFLKHWSASGTSASGTYSVIFNITESGNKVNFAVTSGSSQWSTARTSGGELQENKWNLVTCTFNTSNSSNSGIKIYINGSEPSDDSGYPTGSSVTSIAQSDDFAIGASGQSGSPSGTVEDFDGYMMDFATWNTTLSLSDHQSLWNSYNQTTNAGGALATTVSNNNIIAYYSGITGGGTPANESTGSASGGTNMNVTTNTNVAEAGITPAAWVKKGTA